MRCSGTIGIQPPAIPPTSNRRMRSVAPRDSAPWRDSARASFQPARRQLLSRPTWRAASSNISQRPSVAPRSIGRRRSFWMRRANRCFRASCRSTSVRTSRRASPGSHSARRLGLKTTGNAGGVHNLIVATPGKALDMQSFLMRMNNGLLVTELMGQGVNGVTGDYSRGASGFWVENGTIAYPVHEVTIAGNLKQMFLDIVGVGSDEDFRGTIRTGSVLIGEMTIAGD